MNALNESTGQTTPNGNGSGTGNGPTGTNDSGSQPKGWIRRFADWIGASMTSMIMAALLVVNAAIWAAIVLSLGYFNASEPFKDYFIGLGIAANIAFWTIALLATCIMNSSGSDGESRSPVSGICRGIDLLVDCIRSHIGRIPESRKSDYCITVVSVVLLHFVFWVVAIASLFHFGVGDELYLIGVGVAVNIALGALVLLALRSLEEPVPTSNVGTEFSAVVDVHWLCKVLKLRARKLRRAAWAYLFFTFALFGAAIWAFDYVQQYVEQETGVNRPSPPLPYTDVAVCEENVVVVGGEGMVLVSFDNGENWQRPRINASDPLPLEWVEYSQDCTTAIAVGLEGAILFSTDRGQTWSQADAATEAFRGIALSGDGRKAIVVGDISLLGSDGVIRVSNDRGETWGTPDISTPPILTGIAMRRDGEVAVAVGVDGIILSSSDGLENWNKHTPAFAGNSGDPLDFFDVALSADGTTAIAVGESGLIGLGKLEEIQGESPFAWSRASGRFQDASLRLHTVELSAGQTVAMAVGNNGTILRGLAPFEESWMDIGRGDVTQTLRDIVLSADGRTAVAVGDGGIILVTNDMGESWKLVESSSVRGTIHAVAIAGNGRTAIIVGENRNLSLLALSDEQSLELEKIVPEGSESDNITSNSPPSDIDEWWQDPWWKASVLRVGIVAILIFMVSYLISLTRHNFRLAAFYDARRDVLYLLFHGRKLPEEIGLNQLEQIIQAFSPDDIDSRRPDTPSWIKQLLIRAFDKIKPG